MDYFQGVVTEFLRANRSTFVNMEYLIQLDEGQTPAKSRYWYCDALAVNFEQSTVYLCEITYSKTLSALINRLKCWASNWENVCSAIARDSSLSGDWKFQPWVFIPEESRSLFLQRLSLVGSNTSISGGMPLPVVTSLESVTPWNYCTWDRKHEIEE